MILDLFAGPGGWDVGARRLGLDPIGIELDRWACTTRATAGLRTIRASVTDVRVPAKIAGLIASPPCPTFSAAGNGAGMADMPWLHRFIEDWGRYGWRDPWALHAWSDPRTPLVLEPLRFLAADPEWVAFEQVPSVLPLWEQIAAALRASGWRGAWAGVLNAADHGVPQTRRRAFLLAHRSRPVSPPAPTHARHPEPSLFGDELAPWVTMAEALGWGFDGEPGPTVTGGGTGSVGGVEVFASRATRERLAMVPETFCTECATTDPRGDVAGPWHKRLCSMWQPPESLEVNRRTNSRGPNGTVEPTVGVPTSRPAPTLDGQVGRKWVLNPGATDTQPNRRRYDLDEPAPTVAFGHDAASWAWERPATTIVGTFAADVVAAPGYRQAGDGPRQNAPGSVKITETDAATLQSFPPDYPWQGPKTARFLQIGNAVPPLLAERALREVAS